VGVRSAQFGDHFANQIIEVAAMRYPGEKRFIALANFLPIVARHVRVPIEVALDAPRFVEHFAPLFARVDLGLQLAEIELAFADLGLAGDGFDDAVDRSGFVNDKKEEKASSISASC